MRRLAVVGDLLEDVVVWPSRPLAPGSDTPAQVVRTRGGSAATVALLAAPHVPTRFLGCVGTDPLGDRLLDAMAGVELRVQRRGRTGSVVVLVDPSGERTFLTDRGAAADLAPVPETDLDGVALLHVPVYGLHGGRTASSVRALLRAAVARGVEVVLDASSWAVLREVPDLPALVEELRPVAVLANAAEAAELPSLPVLLVVKDGARPTVLLRPDGSRAQVPVPPVDGVRDSTGAGDAFAAGWLTARLTGRDETACVVRAHALARTVLASPGATTATAQEET